MNKNGVFLNKDFIFEKVKNIMVNVFALDPESISPEKNLHDDLELDSLDMVDFIITLNDQLKKKFEPSAFKEAKTVQDLADLIKDVCD
jgi:acyl carrier protein